MRFFLWTQFAQNFIYCFIVENLLQVSDVFLFWLFLGLLKVASHSCDKIFAKQRFLSCNHWLLNFLRLHFLNFSRFFFERRFFLNNGFWLFFYKVDDVVNLLTHCFSFDFFLNLLKIYLQPEKMYIGISLELQSVSIGFSSGRFKFGIHWENDHVKLLNFGISIDPSEVRLLILGLY